MGVTYEEQRTEQEKRIDADVVERVRRGLAWLEETHGPGWEDKIDMATLELEDADRCVLGQVYRGESPNGWTGYDHAWFMLPERDTYGHGFNVRDDDEFPALQEAWVFVLTPRVKQPS